MFDIENSFSKKKFARFSTSLLLVRSDSHTIVIVFEWVFMNDQSVYNVVTIRIAVTFNEIGFYFSLNGWLVLYRSTEEKKIEPIIWMNRPNQTIYWKRNFFHWFPLSRFCYRFLHFSCVSPLLFNLALSTHYKSFGWDFLTTFFISLLYENSQSFENFCRNCKKNPFSVD